MLNHGLMSVHADQTKECDNFKIVLSQIGNHWRNSTVKTVIRDYYKTIA